LVADEWMSKMVHENLGPLHIHDVHETVSKPIKNDVALEVPRYENGFLYPTTAPGIGVALNAPAIAPLITPGQRPALVTK